MRGHGWVLGLDRGMERGGGGGRLGVWKGVEMGMRNGRLCFASGEEQGVGDENQAVGGRVEGWNSERMVE